MVLSKEENHVLAMAEKEKTEPAYHFTVEDPNAFMPGGSQPNVMIDTGRYSLFFNFRKYEYLWSFSTPSPIYTDIKLYCIQSSKSFYRSARKKTEGVALATLKLTDIAGR